MLRCFGGRWRLIKDKESSDHQKFHTQKRNPFPWGNCWVCARGGNLRMNQNHSWFHRDRWMSGMPTHYDLSPEREMFQPLEPEPLSTLLLFEAPQSGGNELYFCSFPTQHCLEGIVLWWEILRKMLLSLFQDICLANSVKVIKDSSAWFDVRCRLSVWIGRSWKARPYLGPKP